MSLAFMIVLPCHNVALLLGWSHCQGWSQLLITLYVDVINSLIKMFKSILEKPR